MITSAELRNMFLSFFKQRDHRIVTSASVVPKNDPSLLFTNAGMNQFKDIFLGLHTPSFKRAASVQKCIRVSGKHNDLEDVGKDGRHHTFFEMLGNWSFGDYYKKEAARWAWEFVSKHLGLPEKHLWVSVYTYDQEAYDIWVNHIGVDRDKIVKLGNIREGDEENFWSMGETGPCGPCSEIYYDYSPEEPKDLVQGSEQGEIIELWNLVFMEYNREHNGKLTPLPAKNIDTGLGLERTLAVLQEVRSDYRTDLFLPLLEKVEQITGCSSTDPQRVVSFRVIADHIRSIAFSIADGVIPSNEGRGYVLRRILRRAVRHGKLLGLDQSFLHQLIDPLVEVMKEHYPELEERRQLIHKIVLNEEELFLKTLDRGMEEFNKTVDKLKKEGSDTFPGEEAFVLHDTYGFPLDLTEIMAREVSLEVDRKGFEKQMALQRQRAREGSRFQASEEEEWTNVRDQKPTAFTGYQTLKQEDMKIIKYRSTEDGIHIVFDKTPFYAGAGGQVGDTGYVKGNGTRLRIIDVKKWGELFVHLGKLEKGKIKDTSYTGVVDEIRRKKIMSNHTATHLLHYALRKVLGPQTAQSGSLVEPARLRFDFNHYQPLDIEQIDEIEDIVNQKVMENIPVNVHYDVPLDEAKSMGALALFGEKYSEKVRVVEIEGLTMELCGGTHVERTGSIGPFKILRESSISSGFRRIEAVTGNECLKMMRENQKKLQNISQTLGGSPHEISQKIQSLQNRIKELEKKLKKSKKEGLEKVFDLQNQVVKLGKFNT
ncbi:MAG: alanine--tRNA ligase, partial [Spirochaetota bacterium]